jgi:hypothetical protein
VSPVLFVSVAQSFDSTYSLSNLEPWVERAWAISAGKAMQCDRVVAVFEGRPVAAWRIRGTFASDEMYQLSNGDERPRTALSLGDPLPVLAEYHRNDLMMRRGVVIIDCDVEPFPVERVPGRLKRA